MNPAFLDVLDELVAEYSEYFRSRNIALRLALRSTDRPKNSQVLILSHQNSESEAIIWESGEAELTSSTGSSSETRILTKHYATLQEARESLRTWLLAQVNA